MFCLNVLSEFLKRISVVIFFLSSSAYSLNFQQFSRSNSLAYEMIEDTLSHGSMVETNYDWMFNLGFSHVNAPLAVKDENNSSQLDTVIESLSSVHLGVSWYFKENLQLGIQSYVGKFKDGSGESHTSVGDLDFRLKYRFYSDGKNSFAVMPTVTVPISSNEFSLTDTSGNLWGEDSVTSDDGIGYGVRLIYERAFKYFQVAINLGYLANSDAMTSFSNTNIQIDNRERLQAGVGFYIPITDAFGVNLEYMKHWTKPFFNDDINPSEVFLGASFGITRRLVGFAGAGFGNFSSSKDGNDWRAVAGIKFVPRLSKKVKEREESLVSKKVVVVKDAPIDETASLDSFTGEEEKTGLKENTFVSTLEKKQILGETNTFTVLFPNNGYRLSQSQIDSLLNISSRILERSNYVESITIHGHTSKKGSVSYNEKLAKKRALEVKNTLVSQGVDEGLIKELVSKGERLPLNEEVDAQAEAKNRRVEVLIIEKQVTGEEQ